MEEIICEHFSSLESFRSLSLIFDVDPPFIKNSIFGIEAYQKGGIYLNRNNGVIGLNSIQMIKNGKKEITALGGPEGQNGIKKGL